MKNSYVYIHRRSDNLEIFYIGIGNTKNYYRAYSKNQRNKYWKNIVNKVGYEVEILIDNITWEEAIYEEMLLISELGRKDLNMGFLVNLTNGGEGTDGVINSFETITRKRRLKNILNKSSKFRGVHFNKLKNKWTAQIRINGKKKFLGYFKTELEASNAYETKLLTLK